MIAYIQIDKPEVTRIWHRSLSVLSALAFWLNGWTAPVLALTPIKPAIRVAAQQSNLDKNIKVRKGPHSLRRVSSERKFSLNPSDTEIRSARVLAEPLIPMAGATSAPDNAALAAALSAYRGQSARNDIKVLEKFITSHPNSRWRAALELNMGFILFRQGYLSKALNNWSQAWQHSKNGRGKDQVAIANRSLARLLVTYARLGMTQQLEDSLNETKTRPFFGSDVAMVSNARNGLWAMKHTPDCAFKCGPFAIDSILSINKKHPSRSKVVLNAKSTSKGTNLVQVKNWASELGLQYQIAKRSPGASVVVPSIAHWRVGHFAAIVKEERGRYILKDTTFDTDATLGMVPAALDSEMDGYYLIPKGPLAPGWSAVSDEEGKTVWGKGDAFGPNDNSCSNQAGQNGNGFSGSKGPNTPPPPPPNSCPTPMTTASILTMTASLRLFDTPLSYQPPIGPSMDFTATYNQYLTNQPTSFTFTNIGRNWSLGSLSYLTIDPNTQVATIRLIGGGCEVYIPNNGVYNPDLISQAVFAPQPDGSYQRKLPDGSIQIYDQPDGSGNIFMTQMVDPQNNSTLIQFDSNFRISSLTDCINQVTVFNYVSNTPGNPGFYNLASISDPFGRTCSFRYDAAQTNLIAITDCINITSSITYDTSSTFATSLTTPYGTTSFYSYVPSVNQAPGYPARGIRTLYADGTTTVLENYSGPIRTSYYWDREATMQYPNDPATQVYTHCVTNVFGYDVTNGMESAAVLTTKKPLESLVSFTYSDIGVFPEDVNGIYKPLTVGRNLANAGGFKSLNLTFQGTPTINDYLTLSIVFNPTFTYQVKAGDTNSTIAQSFANEINQQNGSNFLHATATGATITLTSDGLSQENIFLSSSSGSETLTINTTMPQKAFFTIPSGIAAGTNLDPGYYGAEASYTVQTGDTPNTIASGLSAAVNASATYQAAGVSAIANGATAILSSTNGDFMQFYPTNLASPVQSNSNYQVYQYSYNDLGMVTRSIDPVGRTFYYTYAPNQIDLLNVTSNQGSTSYQLGAWTYNSQHRPLTSTDGSGQVTSYQYNSAGQLTQVTDPNGNITKLTYVGGFLTQVDGPMPGDDDVTTFSYDPQNRLRTTTDAEGYTLTFFYDNANRPTQTIYPDDTTEQTVYDRLDAVMTKDRISRWTQSSYDSLDQLAYTIDPRGCKTQYDWCSCGSLRALTDPNGNITTWHHDLQGRITRKVYQDQTAVNYVYDPDVSLLRSRTDALGQAKYATFNPDNTIFQISYSNAVNPTGMVTYSWDSTYNRLVSVQKSDWGTYTYAYNPYFVVGGAAITGGGMLQSVHNDVIANSDITYQYDNLGRTTNRSINGAANSISWAYDQMSRITNETNALGAFSYNYVDDAPNFSKGTGRLASINYPNGQVTNFGWYNNTGDQRLQQISNLKSDGTALSQFSYGYDPAGQITQWQQQQAGNNQVYTLDYDPAGQLTTATAGLVGMPQPSANLYHYSYDCGANRTSVQQATVSVLNVGGSITPGDTLTVVVTDSGLAGGSQAVSYVVLSGDTATAVAAQLASAITANPNLQALGVNAVSNQTNVTINSASTNVTTFSSSLSSGATEMLTFGINRNSFTNVVLTGSATAGDTVSIKVHDPALSGGVETVSYAVQAGNSLSDVANELASAINSDANLSAISVNAVSSQAVVRLSSGSANVTTYTQSVSTNATESLNFAIPPSSPQNVFVSGTTTAGDELSLIIYDSGLASGSQTVTYKVQSGDSTASVAQGLATAVNTNGTIAAVGITASATGAVVNLTSLSINKTSYRVASTNNASEVLIVGKNSNGTQTAAVNGTANAGDILYIKVLDDALTNGSRTLSYTVVNGDTTNSIATGLASAIDGDAQLAAIGITATAVTSVVNIKSTSVNATSYVASTSIGSDSSIVLGPTCGIVQAAFNNVNELVGLAPGGQAELAGTTSKPVVSASINTQMLALQTPPPAAADLTATAIATRPGTENFTFTMSPAVDGEYIATFNGTVTPGDTVTWTLYEARLPSGTQTISYTVQPGDTLENIYDGFAGAIAANQYLHSVFQVELDFSVIYIYDLSSENSSGVYVPNSAGFSSVSQGVASETVTASTDSFKNPTVTVGGAATVGDAAIATFSSSNTHIQSLTIIYQVQSGDTAATIASNLSNNINSNSKLHGAGISSSVSGSTVTVCAGLWYTVSTSSGATATLSLTTASGTASLLSVQGTVTPGDVVSITTHSGALPGQQQTVSYTVQSTDSLLSIAANLAAAMNSNSALNAVGVKVNSGAARLLWSQYFKGNGYLPPGVSSGSVAITDKSSSKETSCYQVSAKEPASATTLTFDANGNMTSDGTNKYAWDAENRMIKITYPGSNNFSAFVFDGLSRNVSIVETTSGSVTSTKQFVWYGLTRSEDRNSTGTINTQFFGRGEIISGVNEFYAFDMTGSVRELTNTTGVIQDERIYDPYGRVSQLQGLLSSDMQYAKFYAHARSGLSLSCTRAYKADLGRWLSRDMIEESTNFYNYAANNPINYIDPSGLRPTTSGEDAFLQSIFKNCFRGRNLSVRGIRGNRSFSPGLGTMYMTLGNFINGDYTQPLNLQNSDVAGQFAHEALHELQAESGINVPLEGIGLQALNQMGQSAYTYTPSDNAAQNLDNFLNASIEQQGQMMQDFVSGSGGGNFADIIKYIQEHCSCRKKG